MSETKDKKYLNRPLLLAGVSLVSLVGYSASQLTNWSLGPMTYLPAIEVGLGMTTIAAFVVIWRRLARWGKRVEHEACESESRIRALNNHAIVSILDENAKITYVNDRFVDVFGYTTEELIGRDSTLIHPDGQPASFNAVRACLAKGEPWEGELCSQTKSGEDVWTKTTIYPTLCQMGELTSAICVHTDLTEIKKAQHERDLRQSLHLLHDEICVFDAETLNFTYMNEAAMLRTGWAESDYVNKHISDALPEYNSSFFRKHIAPLIAGEVAQMTHRRDLFGRPSEISLQYISGREGNGQLLVVCRDISAQQEYQRKRDAFVSTVSHELRSPMTSIKGGLDLVLSGAVGKLPPQSEALVKIAQRNASRLILIINDILDLEKISAGQMIFDIRQTDIAALIGDAAVANQAFCQKYDVELRLSGTRDPVQADCDADRMFQVLTNLISNAAKFSNSSKVVDVRLSQEENETLIQIEDYGVGIPQDALAYVFGRFTQVADHDRKAKGGTGLGLSIVKAIVEEHRGTVVCESVLGRGTIFTVRIPTKRSEETVESHDAQLEAAE